MPVPFRAISVFHAVARSGSITRAADELGVTPSAVSQQIQTLEVSLGTALIGKSGRNIVLTEAGERYFEMIGGEIDRIMEATQRIQGFRSVTTLTVRATPSLSTKWLLPRLAAFVEAHPDIELRLDGTNEPAAFQKESVDLEIRHGTGGWPGLYAEGLVEENFRPVCAPSLAAPGSLGPEDLARHRLIHSVKSQVQWGHWFKLAGVAPATRWRRLLFDRTHMAIDAAAGGLGIALESDLMLWGDLASNRLACPVRDPPRIALVTQWITCPHDHLRYRKVRAFLDWLRTERDSWAAERAQAATTL
ncbi:LysR substrate-binding domain-containing protein [Methylobacterium nodulans]|uniref:Transcriptional regulator, LysR family n=1 Tax=Methylobacterium nodulans (strain LMG 21967 / CNCM I-2342 / ORS 2060) TaxID=460265 RepID=B8IHI3_METNO|nr:LysR substrate-binding domain-containing protein [Methylobacterium nodulans]ACL61646.1 transcriptional regulator, LysR family [Methylobacterium nodulans ORS 2060]